MSALSAWQHALGDAELPRTLHTGSGKGVAADKVKSVLLWLSTYAGYETTDRAFPGNDRLARQAQVSTDTVKRALAIGCELGWIELAHQGGGRDGKANEYRLTYPKDRGPLEAPGLVGTGGLSEEPGASGGTPNVHTNFFTSYLSTPEEENRHVCTVWCEARGYCA